MIKIVYRDLSPGLHASAEADGRNTVISFLPGLTPEQRRAALRRIQHSGRMGHGPRVPAARLAVALAVDRIKAGARTCAAVVRVHPAGSTLPVFFFSIAAVIFVMMATVSIHVLPSAPRSSGQEPIAGGVTPVPGSAVPVVIPGVAPSSGRGSPSWEITLPGRFTARRFASSGTSAAGSRALPSGTQGAGAAGSAAGAATTPATGYGSLTPEPVATTGSVGSLSLAGSSGSAGAGRGTTGSGTTGSGGRGARNVVPGGPMAGGTSGPGTGASTGTGGTGSTGPGDGGSGTRSRGRSGSGRPGTGGTGSWGPGHAGTGSGGPGSKTSGRGSPPSGGTCVDVLSVLQACVGL